MIRCSITAQLTCIQKQHSNKLINALLYGIDVHIENRKFHHQDDMNVRDSMHKLAEAFDLNNDDKRMLR